MSSVGGREFLPKHRGCFKLSSFTELVQRFMTCWLLFCPFDIFEGRVGLFLCGRTPCAIATPDMSIWNVSRVLTLYQTSPFLACITASSTLAQQESAGLGQVQMESCTSWDYNLQFLFPGRWLFPLHVECGTVLCKTVESEFRSWLQTNTWSS